MIYKISDLLVQIPNTGDMLQRCKSYSTQEKDNSADIIIRADLYDLDRWPNLGENDSIYMESCFQFYYQLLLFNGMMFHASAIEYKGKAYLFSGPCGMGKSTHTRLWQSVYGDEAQVFNDDKPALRRIDGKWYAYGTPWCGKDGINQNKKVPLGGICFLGRGKDNTIYKLNKKEALINVLSQTTYKPKSTKKMEALLTLSDYLIREIPIFKLQCLPNEEAAILSSTTMFSAAQEANL